MSQPYELQTKRLACSQTLHTSKDTLRIDFANSITIGRSKEHCSLLFVVDNVDFTLATPCVSRSEPEDLTHEFLSMTGIKISNIRVDGAGEFAKSTRFRAYCAANSINIEEVPAHTHTFNARCEGAMRICKEKVRALLLRAKLPRRFWPDALFHLLRTYAHWPDATCRTAWEKLDTLRLWHTSCATTSRGTAMSSARASRGTFPENTLTSWTPRMMTNLKISG
jgi:hypothetical protein